MAKKRQPMLPGMPRNRELLSDAARYKKGYTPKRQEEMADALKNTEVDFIHGSGKKASELSKGNDLLAGTQKGMVNRSRQTVVSAFANSSIKPKRIEGLKKVELHAGGVPVPKEEGDTPFSPQGVSEYETKVSGMYSGPEKTIKVARGLEKTGKNRVQHTLRHELGHHVTIPLLNDVADAHPDKFDTDEYLFGSAEGVADNFAHKTAGKTFKGRGNKGAKSTYATLAQDSLGYGNDNLSENPDSDMYWAEGYVGSVDSKTRNSIFHTARVGAKQLEIGFGQN
jgi:hypothetical protein